MKKKIGIVGAVVIGAIAIVLCVALLMGSGSTPPVLLERSMEAAFNHSFAPQGTEYDVPVYVNDVHKPSYSAELVIEPLSVSQINNINSKFPKVSYSEDGYAVIGESEEGVAFSQVKGVTDKKSAVSAAGAVLNALGFSTQNCVGLANNVGSQWGVELYFAVEGVPVVKAISQPKGEAPAPTPTPFGAPAPTLPPQTNTFERETLRMYVAFDAEKGIVAGVLGQNIGIRNEKKEEMNFISAQKAAEKYEEALDWYAPSANSGVCARLCYAAVEGKIVPVWRVEDCLPEAEELAHIPDVLIHAVTGEIISN